MNPRNRALSLVSKPYLPLPQIHQIISQLIISASISSRATLTSLITLLTTPPNSSLHDAYSLFRILPNASTLVYNSMIQAFFQHDKPRDVIFMCKQMMGSHHQFPNHHTFSFVLRACRQLYDGSLGLGLMFHALAIKLGMGSWSFVKTGLIHFYARNNCMDFARDLFDQSGFRSGIAWTVMIDGYFKIGEVGLARDLFDQCVFRDGVTWTVMINGYFRHGEVGFAREMFDEMREKNADSWSAMVQGYAEMRLFKEAIGTFVDMRAAGFLPTSHGVVGALTACSFLGDLDQGRWIHGYVENTKMELDNVLGTALVEMYAKCGCIDMAMSVFEEIPCKDTIAFTSLISGLADHGEGERVLEVFARMKRGGIRPDWVTFIAVLSGCSKAGLVEEGLQIFESMKVEYGIEPRLEHYGCLVDLLGRSGMVEQAKEILSKMPMKHEKSVFCAFLNSCRLHGGIDIEKELAWLDENIPLTSGVHALIWNIYASTDQWDDAQKVSERMREKQVKKTPGYSFVAI